MKICMLVSSLLLVACSLSAAGLDPETFRNPPAVAKPMTWMHMMNSNASKEGLSKDLRALSNADARRASLDVYDV